MGRGSYYVHQRKKRDYSRMSISTSIKAYQDCYPYLDQALESPIGIRIDVGSGSDGVGAAHQLRMRLHYARKLSRVEAEKVYPFDHPSHGVSVYDSLVIRIREAEGKWWIYIQPWVVKGAVEELAAE